MEGVRFSKTRDREYTCGDSKLLSIFRVAKQGDFAVETSVGKILVTRELGGAKNKVVDTEIVHREVRKCGFRNGNG